MMICWKHEMQGKRPLSTGRHSRRRRCNGRLGSTDYEPPVDTRCTSNIQEAQPESYAGARMIYSQHLATKRRWRREPRTGLAHPLLPTFVVLVTVEEVVVTTVGSLVIKTFSPLGPQAVKV
jgi:hypothetical protein